MGEADFDFLAQAARVLEGFGSSKCAGHIAGGLVDVSGELSIGLGRTTIGFERAFLAIEFAGSIRKSAIVHVTGRSEALALWAGVVVAFGIEAEGAFRDDAFALVGALAHRHVRVMALATSQPTMRPEP